jgi:hypothetical protein
MSDADLLLNLHSRFPSPSPSLARVGSGAATATSSNTTSTKANPFTTSSSNATSPSRASQPQTQQEFSASHNMPMAGASFNQQMGYGGMPGHAMGTGMGMFTDMMIESQEMDLSDLSNDMAPWLEYLPHDMFFYDGSGSGNGNAGQGDGRGTGGR